MRNREAPSLRTRLIAAARKLPIIGNRSIVSSKTIIGATRPSLASAKQLESKRVEVEHAPARNSAFESAVPDNPNIGLLDKVVGAAANVSAPSGSKPSPPNIGAEASGRAMGNSAAVRSDPEVPTIGSDDDPATASGAPNIGSKAPNSAVDRHLLSTSARGPTAKPSENDARHCAVPTIVAEQSVTAAERLIATKSIAKTMSASRPNIDRASTSTTAVELNFGEQQLDSPRLASDADYKKINELLFPSEERLS